MRKQRLMRSAADAAYAIDHAVLELLSSDDRLLSMLRGQAGLASEVGFRFGLSHRALFFALFCSSTCLAFGLDFAVYNFVLNARLPFLARFYFYFQSQLQGAYPAFRGVLLASCVCFSLLVLITLPQARQGRGSRNAVSVAVRVCSVLCAVALGAVRLYLLLAIFAQQFSIGMIKRRYMQFSPLHVLYMLYCVYAMTVVYRMPLGRREVEAQSREEIIRAATRKIERSCRRERAAIDDGVWRPLQQTSSPGNCVDDVLQLPRRVRLLLKMCLDG